jgi:hypothetical protein
MLGAEKAAERALELAATHMAQASRLANEADNVARALPDVAKDLFSAATRLADTAALLSHYAEIMRAESVAYVNENGFVRQCHLTLKAKIGDLLIIKPEPK